MQEQTSTTRDLLTTSRLKAYRRCPRLHHYRYNLGRAPVVEADALRFGTLWHQCVEEWWMAEGDRRLDFALRRLAGAECDPFDRVRVEVLLCGYHTRWADVPLETIAVEQEFVGQLRNPRTGMPSRTWDVAGKIDAVARDPQGRIWIVEHKTASADLTPGSPYWQRLALDGQVSLYFYGAALAGHGAVAGCIYDVVGKPQLRPGLATPPELRKFTKDGRLYASQREADETPDAFRSRLTDAVAANPNSFFQRGEVVRLDGEVDDALTDVWITGGAISNARRQDCHPRNPDACDMYHRMCEFFDVCTGCGSLDDPTRFKKLQSAHPELDLAPTARSKED